ncbi:MAG: phosphate acyltransferase [Persicimonas sp.]
MNADICSELINTLRLSEHSPQRVVFADGHDPRVVEAARLALEQNLAAPILIGAPDEMASAASSSGVDLEGIELHDPATSERFDEYAVEFAEQRNIPLRTARCMSSVPFFYAAMMLCRGEADAMVVGANCSSQEALMATDLAVGAREDVPTPSSFLVLELPVWSGSEGSLLALADCAVNPQPNANQLADIALETADSVEDVLGWQARVALLSHSTHSHPLEPRAEHVCRAVDIVRRRAPGIRVDGELQLDAALNAAVARQKLSQAGGVAGRANTLIFPDLNSGNIAAKMAQQLGGATVCGPVLQGFEKPVGLLSRASSIQDVLGTLALTAGYALATDSPRARSFSNAATGADAAANAASWCFDTNSVVHPRF